MRRMMGFTVVELVAVMGIVAIIFSISLIGVSVFNPKDDLDGFYEIFLTNLKQQQIYALTGQTSGQIDNGNYGVYIDGDGYVLFRGTNYNEEDVDNFEVRLDDLVLSTTFPQSTIVFEKDGGAIDNYSDGSNTVSLEHLHDNKSIVVSLGKYGTIEQVTKE